MLEFGQARDGGLKIGNNICCSPDSTYCITNDSEICHCCVGRCFLQCGWNVGSALQEVVLKFSQSLWVIAICVVLDITP